MVKRSFIKKYMGITQKRWLEILFFASLSLSGCANPVVSLTSTDSGRDVAKKKPGILPGSFRLENVENVIRITR